MAKLEQYNHSVLETSDEVPDIYCEPCHQDGHIAIAEGYCVDCPEYLCGPCYKIHRRHKALANHVLLDKDSMPLTTDTSTRVVDVCETKCPIHPNKVTEIFCKTCDKLACAICVVTDHRLCEEVKHIPDIVQDFDEEFNDINENIKSTANAISYHEEKLQANVTSSNEMRTLAQQELKRQRAKVNSYFDQLEKEMDRKITAIEERNKDTLKAASCRLDQMKTDFDQIKNDIQAKNTAQRCEMFIAMKWSQEKLKTFQDQFDRMQKELVLQHYTLLPSEQIQAMMRTTTEICRIATARLESEIDIKTTNDRKDPSIWGLNIMHGHFCVAIDKGNSSIKVIDTNSKCVTSEVSIQEGDILAITPVSDDQIAVSVSVLFGRDQIQFFSLSASGVIQRTKKLVDADDCYSGMVHCAGNIYGVNIDGIYKIDMTGKIIRTFHTEDIAGIAVSPDGQTLYVTNEEKHSVTSMTLDGKVRAVHKEKDLKKPEGIIVDKYGYVYVCSRDTNILQQFTPDLNKVQVLIDVKCDAMTYSSTENKLYIGVGNQIRLYSLDLK